MSVFPPSSDLTHFVRFVARVSWHAVCVTITDAGTAHAPARADGIELIGEYEGSGYKEPPSLVRRMDGQIIQLPPLLFAVVEAADGTRGYDELAEIVSNAIQRRLDAEQVEFLVEEKLRPLGVLAAADGTSPKLEKPDPFLALKFRAAVISERTSDRLGMIFKGLFVPVVVLAVLGSFVAADIWLFFFHGVAQALRESIYHPGLFLPLFLGVVLSAAFHEIGHAAACRYGGGHPGKMGCGIYLAWPAFYTDVTDAYRLGRRARLRTDLGGVYFNVVIVLLTAAAYFATGFEPLLLLIVLQHLEIAHQLLPVVRLDGYYIVADLTGVPDLFARIGPILTSLAPWKRADERVTVLKRWVRVAVTAWVLVVVPLLLFELLVVLIHLPRIIGTAWDSGGEQLEAARAAFADSQLVPGITAVLQLIVLTIPILGILIMLGKVGAGIVRGGWSKTDGRPVLRAGFVAIALGLAVLLAMAWLPSQNYAPIKPGERGTLAQGAAAVRHLPSEGPLYSEHAVRTAADPTTDTGADSTTGDAPVSADPNAATATTATTALDAADSQSSSGEPTTTAPPSTTTTEPATTTTTPPSTTTAPPTTAAPTTTVP
jgi:putative peptide zinc metalloprotease protein